MRWNDAGCAFLPSTCQFCVSLLASTNLKNSLNGMFRALTIFSMFTRARLLSPRPHTPCRSGQCRTGRQRLLGRSLGFYEPAAPHAQTQATQEAALRWVAVLSAYPIVVSQREKHHGTRKYGTTKHGTCTYLFDTFGYPIHSESGAFEQGAVAPTRSSFRRTSHMKTSGLVAATAHDRKGRK